jgi:peroxiredoxin Q/BCP
MVQASQGVCMKRWTLVFAVLLAGTSSATAQVKPLAVGTMAPDFKLPAATSAGVLPKQFHLSELRGRTVVLAFFFKARTSG